MCEDQKQMSNRLIRNNQNHYLMTVRAQQANVEHIPTGLIRNNHNHCLMSAKCKSQDKHLTIRDYRWVTLYPDTFNPKLRLFWSIFKKKSQSLLFYSAQLNLKKKNPKFCQFRLGMSCLYFLHPSEFKKKQKNNKNQKKECPSENFEPPLPEPKQTQTRVQLFFMWVKKMGEAKKETSLGLFYIPATEFGIFEVMPETSKDNWQPFLFCDRFKVKVLQMYHTQKRGFYHTKKNIHVFSLGVEQKAMKK